MATLERIRWQVWAGLYTDGYFVHTVSKFGDEGTISQYVKDQGTEKEYKKLHQSNQLTLFEE